MTAPGYGWKLVAFDASTRTGEVSLRGWRLPFDALAARDEDLRVGDDVFVWLLPPSSQPHVAMVWPCVARLRVPEDVRRLAAPELSDAIASSVARTLSAVAVPVELYPVERGERRVALLAADVMTNTYGIGGMDITVRGAFVCDDAQLSVQVTMLAAASVRLALPEERSVVHAVVPLDSRRVVVALAEARGEFAPDAAAKVVLVSCERVSWQPGPSHERVTEVRRALAALVGYGLDVTAIDVEGRALVAARGARRERFFELTSSEVAAFGVWCETVNALLGGARGEED